MFSQTAVTFVNTCIFILLLLMKGRSSTEIGFSDRTCDMSSCPDIPFDDLTQIKCSDDFNIGSICRFTCPTYHGRVGEPSIQCQTHSDACGAGGWSSRIPYCRALFCPELPSVNEAEITCTRKRKLGSICKYSCLEGFSLIPAGHTGFMCYKNATWVGDPLPCCERHLDLILILDSSSSVGRDSWERVQGFLRSLIDEIVSDLEDAIRIGAFRYSRIVDEESQILLNDYPNDLEGLLQAVNAISYEGRGTNTARALRYAQRVMFSPENGNRPDASDYIVLLTHGRSFDDVRVVSEELRDQGVEIVVVGIIPGTGGRGPNKEELLEIAGTPKNVEVAEGGFQELSSSQFRKRVFSSFEHGCV